MRGILQFAGRTGVSLLPKQFNSAQFSTKGPNSLQNDIKTLERVIASGKGDEYNAQVLEAVINEAENLYEFLYTSKSDDAHYLPTPKTVKNNSFADSSDKVWQAKIDAENNKSGGRGSRD